MGMLFALCALSSQIGEERSLGDTWTNLKNVVANFKVDITLLADLGLFSTAIEAAVNLAFDYITSNPIVGSIIGDCQLRDLTNADQAVTGDSYYQLVVVCDHMSSMNAIDLSKAKNQRIVLVTSFNLFSKILADPVQAGNISKALAAELNQTLVNILMSNSQPDSGRALSKLMSASPKPLSTAAAVALKNLNKKIEYLALTNGVYDIRDGKVPCCYVGLGATFSFAFEFADYVMTDIGSLSTLVSTGSFIVSNLGVICTELLPVTKVTFTQQEWVVAWEGRQVRVSIQMVQKQLSIMEIVTGLSTQTVDIAFDSQVACHTYPLNISVQSLLDIAADFIPDMRELFSAKQLASTGKLQMTFSGWENAPNNQGSVPLIFEASSDDRIEYDQANMPSQVTVTRSSIDSRPKPGGPKNTLPIWAIALIAVACIAVVAGVGVTIYFAVFRKKEPQSSVKETTPESAQGNVVVVSNNNNNNSNNAMMAAAPQPYQQPYPQQPYPQQQYPQQPYPQQQYPQQP